MIKIVKGELVFHAPFPRISTSIFIGTGKKIYKRKRRAEKNGRRASPRCRTVNIFTLTIAWFLLMKQGRAPLSLLLPPQILCRLKGYIHRSSSFCCRGSRDVGHGIHGLSDDRSIIVSTADIDIILSSLRKNTKSREPSHSTRGLSLFLLSFENIWIERRFPEFFSIK